MMLVWFVDMVAYAFPIIDEDNPSTYKEIVHSVEKVEWNKAMGEEISYQQKNATWKLVELPK